MGIPAAIVVIMAVGLKRPVALIVVPVTESSADEGHQTQAGLRDHATEQRRNVLWQGWKVVGLEVGILDVDDFDVVGVAEVGLTSGDENFREACFKILLNELCFN